MARPKGSKNKPKDVITTLDGSSKQTSTVVVSENVTDFYNAKSVRNKAIDLSDDIIDELCERIALGESLRAVCYDDHMPHIGSIMRWMLNKEDPLCLRLSEQYARAKEAQADSYEDMMLDTARSEADVQRAKLIIDTMKWTASKLKPKKYGDKIDMTTNGKDIPAPLMGGVANAISSNDGNS